MVPHRGNPFRRLPSAERVGITDKESSGPFLPSKQAIVIVSFVVGRNLTGDCELFLFEVLHRVSRGAHALANDGGVMRAERRGPLTLSQDGAMISTVTVSHDCGNLHNLTSVLSGPGDGSLKLGSSELRRRRTS
jgi:hypothetical protein